MTRTRLFLIAAPLLLAGCSLAPKTVLPAPPVSESWPVGDAYLAQSEAALPALSYGQVFTDPRLQALIEQRSEEHTSELQSLMRISYAVFCLKKKRQTKT